MLRLAAGTLTHEGFAASAAVRSCGLRRQVSRTRGEDAPGAATPGLPPPPPPPRTKWTRLVPHPVLIGHAALAHGPV